MQLYSRIPLTAPAPAVTPDDATLDALGEAMTAYLPDLTLSAGASGIPAAYTYLGQFLAHDMSFMAWNPLLGGSGGWENAQALHALDFSSLFGTAPETGARTSQWEEREDSALGLAAFASPGFQRAFDLPRAGGQGAHCCPDSRADTNLALAQMQVLMTRFHQQASVDLGRTGTAARETTQRHLQAVVLTDYLRRIVPDDVFQDVMATGRKLVHTGPGLFLIPIEFAAACCRFGHSMVRESYVHWAIDYPPGSGFAQQTADLSTLAYFTSHGGGLINGCQPFTWCQAWRHMVENANPDLPPTLRARPIQASLAPMFRELERAQFPDTQDPDATGTFNLAQRTLRRGAALGLPSGQTLAAAAGLGGFDVAEFLDARRPRFGALADDATLIAHTPLWFYILAEAETAGGAGLGPLGARVVMETFHAALEAADASIISVAPSGATTVNFTRELRPGDGVAERFALSDVVAVANGGVL
ncbi:hypothetical protein QO033_15445 [Pseudodonghicola sp. IC7]|uniref:Peroxidase n=1 Tax=Pseudodonghicola flavimaris TaxID=3050036 RepID=A0ABT7F3A9_9RHOB|nr:hypothetical protein [Pseudodonghicola flavimaris]